MKVLTIMMMLTQPAPARGRNCTVTVSRSVSAPCLTAMYGRRSADWEGPFWLAKLASLCNGDLSIVLWQVHASG